MKKLFSASAMEKYKKVSTIWWVLIFAVTVFLANAVSYFNEIGEIASEVLNAYQTAGLAVKEGGMVAALVVLSTLFYVVIFELLAKWLCGELTRRFNLSITPKELVFMVRLLLSIINLFFALISLVHFVSPEALSILDAALTVPVTSGMFIWFYAAVRQRIVPPNLQVNCYSFVAKIYFGINIVLNIFYFVGNMFIYDVTLTAINIASLSLALAVSLIMAFVAYIYGKKIKNQDVVVITKPDDDPFAFTILQEEKKDDTIFKDFDI